MRTFLPGFVFLALLFGVACHTPTPAPVLPYTPKNTPVPSVPNTPDPNCNCYTYLALGDSYTIGESVGENERWPVQLAGLLNTQGLQVAAPDIIARTGWTTSELSAAITASGNHRKYNMVSLLIGVNNQYRGQGLDQYRNELAALLDTAIHFAGGHPERVFMLSIPDWGVTPYARGYDTEKIATEIALFNSVAVEECAQKNVAYIYITGVSRTAKNDPTLIAPDSLHFSGKMYALWAQLAFSTGLQVLK